jgi:hypothetical protein
MIEKINSAKGTNINLEQLYMLTNKCFANEWLERSSMGRGYDNIGLTATGLSVIKSRQRKEEALAKRTWLKKASDYIEDHKGLFIIYTAIIAIATLLIKFL